MCERLRTAAKSCKHPLAHIFFMKEGQAMKRKERRALYNQHLTFEDRKLLEKEYTAGAGLSDIATVLGVHISTVYRELARGYTGEMDANGRNGYSAETAQKATLKKPKTKNENGD